MGTRRLAITATALAFALLVTACGADAPSVSPSVASVPSTTSTPPDSRSAAPEAGVPALVDVAMYRSDLAGSVVMPGPGPATAPALAWQADIGPTHYSPILYDGAIIAASSADGRVVAVDAHSGVERWHYDLGEPAMPDDFNGSAAAADGIVFVADPSTLHAIDATTGSQRWQAALPNRGSRPKVQDGVVYAPSLGGVVGFDVATGRRVWEWKGPADVVAEPAAIDGDVMYVAVSQGSYHAVGLSDQRERWRVDLLGQYPTSAVVSGETIYFASRQADAPEPVGELYAVDAATGTIRWRFREPAGTQVTPGPVKDGVIYVSTDANGIYALRDNDTDYSVAWHVDAPSSYFPLSIVDDTLYLQASDGSVGAYSIADGAKSWSTDSSATNGGGHPLVSGGMVFSVLDRGEIRAYAEPALIAQLDVPVGTEAPEPTGTSLAYANPFRQVGAVGWDDLGIGFPLAMDAGPDGLLYVLDAAPRVVVIDPQQGTVVRTWGRAGSGPAEFDLSVIDDNPGAGDIAVAGDGTVYVADANNHRVQEFTAEGEYLDQFGSFGTGDGQFTLPVEIVASADGALYILDHDRVSRFTSDGKFVWRSPDQAAEPDLRMIAGIAVRRDGTVLVAREARERTVLVLDPATGRVAAEWPAPPPGPSQLAADGQGHVLALEWTTENLYLLSEDGQVIGLRSLAAGDKRTALAAVTDWGAGVWPVPVVLPGGHAFTFNEDGLIDLEVDIPR